MKRTFYLVFISISAIFILGTLPKFLVSKIAAAGDLVWQNVCYGEVEKNLQEDGSYLVSCYSPVVTPTLTLEPTSTFTLTITPEPTFTQTVTPEPTSTLTPIPTQQNIARIINHTNLYQFDNLTQEEIQRAQDIKMVFMDRSVGSNVDAGLNCLASPSWGASQSYCRVAYTDSSMTTTKTYLERDFPNVPNEILFSGGMIRNNWVYDFEYGDWQAMVRDFIQVKVPLYYNQGYRVMSFQFSYLNVLNGSTIDEKFFDRTYASGWNVLDLEQLERDYPDVKFVYWTTSLARTIGTADSKSFNEQMRQYAFENNKFLIDMADIESFDMNNNQCLLGNIPIICRDYTTEPDGGHFGSISNGMLKMAKAVWLNMVNITK